MKKKSGTVALEYTFFDRDLSWLSFNERVLTEAQRTTVPLMERIRFLAIYSSNLDEFYRVRVPALAALKDLSSDVKAKKLKGLLSKINETVHRQQQHFGGIIETQILQALRQQNIHLVYKEPVPEPIREALQDYFIHSVATFIQTVNISRHSPFFPANNKLYLVVTVRDAKKGKQIYILNIPSDSLSRFYSLIHQNIHYIVFLDDIVKLSLPKIFADQKILSHHSFKITRDSELNLQDEFTGNLAKKIEKKINERDLGFATRFLFEPGIARSTLQLLKNGLDMNGASLIPGGTYHNLKDLATLPLKGAQFQYEPWPQVNLNIPNQISLFKEIKNRDILLHPPYHTYDTVLRFFNEASMDAAVKTIYVTLYRVANDSRIANALISAAKNGKKVIVFVELKARFDEANNIKWSKKMKAAGVRIIESIPGLKVHAKLALVISKSGRGIDLFGLIATGNFNEATARYYTDHILMTADIPMLAEVETLFNFLKKRKKQSHKVHLNFKHLLVGQFNLQERFIDLINREIDNAKNGLSGGIIIKFNNLEDKVLISKLYEASQAGVKISLIVRGICCLMPGVTGMSENISVKRIIDRYLEHGRIFIFDNNNNPELFLGSADWMNRNIYRRIEVCFPLHDPKLKSEITKIIHLQLADNCQAVSIDKHCNNVESSWDENTKRVRSQLAIAETVATSYT